MFVCYIIHVVIENIVRNVAYNVHVFFFEKI